MKIMVPQADEVDAPIGLISFGPPRTAHFVTPEGRIQQVRYDASLSSWLITVEKDARGQMRPGVSRQAKELGYELLRDVYERWGHPEFYDEYLRWWELREKGIPVGVFPPEMLPPEVEAKKATSAERFSFAPNPSLLAKARAMAPKDPRLEPGARESGEDESKKGKGKGKGGGASSTPAAP